MQTVYVVALICTLGSLIVWGLLRFLPSRGVATNTVSTQYVARWKNAVAEICSAIRSFRDQGRAIAMALVLSVAGHGSFVLAFYFAALTFFSSEEIPVLAAHLFLIPVGMIVQAGIPTPGGLGGGEMVFGFVYQLAGFPFTAGMLASLLRRIISWGLALIAYFAYLNIHKDT